MRHHAAIALSVGLVAALSSVVSSSARAEPWVFQHDEFPSDLQEAADAIDGGQFYTQPGFVAGEAFGQIYKPDPEMFPLQVTGFQIVLAAPPNAPTALYSNATIEIYNSSSTTADPGVSPIFTISTGDLYNPATQDFGFPLTGNTAIHVDFGQGDPEDRPPMITSGNIWLMVRFNDAAQDMSTEWGTEQCLKIAIPELGLETCGCQNTGTVHDNDITGKANVMNIVSPIGACSGSKAWYYMENIPALGSGFKIDGDVILRLEADVASGPCQAQCDGKDCGDDGCGGSCGTCGGELSCYQGECVDCVPNCLSKQCGDDGCGGVCGVCGNGTSCGDDSFCHADCVPSCAGKVCGDNGCGGSCGVCGSGDSCQSGQCVAECAPACSGKECGPDGCGGTCGACTGGESCLGGQCKDDTCSPDCAGKACGDDGCGGSCGTCGEGKTCDAEGACKASDVVPTDMSITSVSPHQAFAGDPTPLSIIGSGFADGASVKLGGYECSNVDVTSASLISAVAPPLTVGTYSVIVVAEDGTVATLEDAFEVLPKDPVVNNVGGSSDGCSAGDGLTTAWGAAALVIAAFLRRRRGASISG